MAVNQAWRRCIARFDEIEFLVNETAKLAVGGSNLAFRTDLYGSWVLMAYAACQFSLEEIGRGCMEFLAGRYRYPSSMPPGVLRNHQRMTLDRVRLMLDENSPSGQILQALKEMHSRNWATSSSLLRMDRNVWPAYIREWLRRLGVGDDSTRWMANAIPGKTDTYESRMRALIEERNPIAHGRSADTILAATLMLEWIGDCRAFMERCAMTVELHLSREHAPRLRKVGEIDRGVQLGNQTVALRVVHYEVAVGDHLLLALNGDRKKVVRVDTIMSEGSSFAVIEAGREMVSLGLSRPHGANNVYLTP